MAVHPLALVDLCAEIHPSAEIGPHVVIEGPVTIGAGTIIKPFAVIIGPTSIGENCRIHSHAVVGDAPQDRAYKDENSSCRIGAGTIIREGVTIHRATGQDAVTSLGRNCHLMTNSHVGHNCVLEDEVTLVSGALLGGHVHVARQAIISGNAAVHQFTRIGRLAMVGGLSKVTQDIPPFMMTDREGSVAGINLVGLRRAGYGPQERADVKEAFRILYRMGLNLPHALELIEDQGTTAVAPLVEFLVLSSRRGLTKGNSLRLSGERTPSVNESDSSAKAA